LWSYPDEPKGKAVTLGSHQTTVGRSDARFTPRSILDRLGTFDTDAAAGDPRPFDIGRTRNITAAMDSLSMDWRDFGRTWLNPPFNRYVVGSFVAKMCGHDHGLMLLHVRPETAWFAPIWDHAAALLFLADRVIFLKADGMPVTIENPEAKHYGKPANSGAPVVLCAFGAGDADVLAGQDRDFGHFVALRIPRFVVIAALTRSWREAIGDFLDASSGPVSLADLYRAFAGHPKAQANPHWREKVRQTLKRGGFTRVDRGVYARRTS
jgi:hypothetical protein